MKIVDVADLLPAAWDENIKAKLVVWALIALLLLAIARLMYLVSDLSTTVNNQGNDMKAMGSVVDTLLISDSVRTFGIQFLISAWAKRDSIDRVKDSTYFHDRRAWEKSEAQKKERWNKWDADNPKYKPGE